MATYIALSTVNAAANGYQPFGLGSTRAEAQTEADATISTDRYRQTLERNLVVLSESAAKRQGYLQRDRYVARCDDHGLYLAGGPQDDVYGRCPGDHVPARV